MSSTVNLYAKHVKMQQLKDGSFDITLEGVDAGDFTSEFNINEVLDQYDFGDIEKYYLIRKGEDEEDWSE